MVCRRPFLVARQAGGAGIQRRGEAAFASRDDVLECGRVV